LRSFDAWDWFKVACLLAFAVGVGLLKRHQFDQELREHRAEEERRNRLGRFTDPFGR
jgi:hypothetical protein